LCTNRHGERGVRDGADLGDPARAVRARRDGGEPPEVRVVVAQQDLGVGGLQAVGPAGGGGAGRQVEAGIGRGHGDRLGEVAELVVADPGGLGEERRLALQAGAGLLVLVPGADADDEVPARGGVALEPAQVVVARGGERRRDEDGVAGRELLR
jgi:hypothetical protein